jgi:hypothetical protein
MFTSSHIHRLALAIGLAGAMLASALAGTAGAQQDLRSPDTRDAAPAAAEQRPVLDARDAIGRTSSLAGTTSETRQDLRSPDAREPVTRTRPVTTAPTWPANPQPIASAPAAQPADDTGGVDWAPIGIAVALSLLAGAGIAALVTRRTRGTVRVAS